MVQDRIIATPVHNADAKMIEENEKEIRILMVDGNEADAEQILAKLRDAGMRIAAAMDPLLPLKRQSLFIF